MTPEQLREAAEHVIEAWDHFESKRSMVESLAELRAALAANPAPAGPVDALKRARDVVHAIAAQDDMDANPAPAGPLDCPCSGCFPAKLDVEQIADLFMDLRLDGPRDKGWTYQQTARWYANIIAARLERKG